MASKIISNAAAIDFPAATGGTNTITHVSVGVASSGASAILFRKALSASLAVSNGIQPGFAVGELTFTDSGDIADFLQNGILDLLFKNAASGLPGVGDATGPLPSATAGSLYIALHTADPGAGGDQTTSEATYTSYARVGVVRSGSGWTLA